MCGIAGIYTTKGSDTRERIARMVAVLRHRGPDASGIWLDEGSGAALGHARLSIVDLSPTGAQPMHSARGR